MHLYRRSKLQPIFLIRWIQLSWLLQMCAFPRFWLVRWSSSTNMQTRALIVVQTAILLVNRDWRLWLRNRIAYTNYSKHSSSVGLKVLRSLLRHAPSMVVDQARIWKRGRKMSGEDRSARTIIALKMCNTAPILELRIKLLYLCSYL